MDSRIRSSKMFEKKKVRENAALDAKIQKVREEEALVASDPSVGAVPEVCCFFLCMSSYHLPQTAFFCHG